MLVRSSRPSLALRQRFSGPFHRASGNPQRRIELPFQVLAETDDWLAINKPRSMHSVARRSLREEGTVTYYIAQAYPGMRRIFANPHEFGAVHRIDRNTSGALVIAKTALGIQNLAYQFREEGSVRKSYWALVHGEPRTSEGQIDAKIAYTPGIHRHVLNEAQAHADGMQERDIHPALTVYRTLETFVLGQERFSLLDITLLTGRTHQIRFHLNAIGHPLVGERYYLPDPAPALPEEMRACFNWGQALHARSLEFRDPRTQQPVQIEAPPPDFFEEAFEFLRHGKTPVVSIQRDRESGPATRRSKFDSRKPPTIKSVKMTRHMRGVEHRVLGNNPAEATTPHADVYYLGQVQPVLWGVLPLDISRAHVLDWMRGSNLVDRAIEFGGSRSGRFFRLRGLLTFVRREINDIRYTFRETDIGEVTDRQTQAQEIFEANGAILNRIADVPFSEKPLLPLDDELLQCVQARRAATEGFLHRWNYPGLRPEQFAVDLHPQFPLLSGRLLQWITAERILTARSQQEVPAGEIVADLTMPHFWVRALDSAGPAAWDSADRINATRMMIAAIFDFQSSLVAKRRTLDSRTAENIGLLCTISDQVIPRLLGGVRTTWRERKWFK